MQDIIDTYADDLRREINNIIEERDIAIESANELLKTGNSKYRYITKLTDADYYMNGNADNCPIGKRSPQWSKQRIYIEAADAYYDGLKK